MRPGASRRPTQRVAAGPGEARSVPAVGTAAAMPSSLDRTGSAQAAWPLARVQGTAGRDMERGGEGGGQGGGNIAATNFGQNVALYYQIIQRSNQNTCLFSALLQ